MTSDSKKVLDELTSEAQSRGEYPCSKEARNAVPCTCANPALHERECPYLLACAPYGRCARCTKALTLPPSMMGVGPDICGDCFRAGPRTNDAQPDCGPTCSGCGWPRTPQQSHAEGCPDSATPPAEHESSARAFLALLPYPAQRQIDPDTWQRLVVELTEQFRIRFEHPRPEPARADLATAVRAFLDAAAFERADMGDERNARLYDAACELRAIADSEPASPVDDERERIASWLYGWAEKRSDEALYPPVQSNITYAAALYDAAHALREGWDHAPVSNAGEAARGADSAEVRGPDPLVGVASDSDRDAPGVDQRVADQRRERALSEPPASVESQLEDPLSLFEKTPAEEIGESLKRNIDALVESHDDWRRRADSLEAVFKAAREAWSVYDADPKNDVVIERRMDDLEAALLSVPSSSKGEP